MSIETLVRTAGMLQLLQPAAIIAGQRNLGWLQELQTLTPLTRRFVYSIAVGVFFYVTGTGIITVVFADAIARSSLGAALCALQSLAWAARAGSQIFSLHPVWTGRGRWLDFGMCGVYSALTCLYTWISAAALS
jgi:hypothetical protein